LETLLKSPRIKGFAGKKTSKKEARRHEDLRLLQKTGVIQKLRYQPVYVLQERFEFQGRVVRPITYIADFEYLSEGSLVIEDVKGRKEEVFRLKWKMLKHHFRDREDVLLLLT